MKSSCLNKQKSVQILLEFVIIKEVELSAFVWVSVAEYYAICCFLLSCDAIHLISIPFDVVRRVSNYNRVAHQILLHFKFYSPSRYLLRLCSCVTINNYLHTPHFCLSPNFINLWLLLSAYAFIINVSLFLWPDKICHYRVLRTLLSKAFIKEN